MPGASADDTGEVWIDATPPSPFVVTADTRVDHLVGTVMPIRDDEGRPLTVGKVTGARVKGDRLQVRIAVPRVYFDLLAGPVDHFSAVVSPTALTNAPSPPRVISSSAEFDAHLGSPAGFFAPGGGADLAPSFSIGRYGGVFSIRMAYTGGFRSRPRVRALRTALAFAGTVPQMVRAQWEMLDGALWEEDRIATCPHRADWRDQLDEDDDVCSGCGVVFPRGDAS